MFWDRFLGPPRLALWPLQANEQDRNVVDRLIAFCASTDSGSRPTPYYFQRPTVHQGTTFGSSQSPNQASAITAGTATIIKNTVSYSE